MKKITTLTTIALLSIFSSTMALADNTSFTNEDEWTAYDAFHNTFIDKTRYIYKSDTKQPSADHRGNGARDNDYSGCASAIWCQAIYFDMAVNAYRRIQSDPNATSATKKTYETRMLNLYNGNKRHYVNFDFNNPNTNNGWFVYDDIMWWTVALARAYECYPSKTEFLTNAEKSFCRVWYGSKTVGDDGSYADPTEKGSDGKKFTGGMFWEWQPIDKAKPHNDNDFKSACINFPTIIACCTLANLVPENRDAPTAEYPTSQTREFYKEKAVELYAWAKAHFVSTIGRVADGIHGGGPEYSDHLYNQATYIGAACMLYKMTGEKKYLTDAQLAVRYVKNNMCTTTDGKIKHYILPFEKGYEQGIYTAIFAQYIDMFVHELGQGSFQSCEDWIYDNIEYAWKNRDQSRNIQDAVFNTAIDKSTIVECYAASAMPALMLLFPAKETENAVKSIKNNAVKNNKTYTLCGQEVNNMNAQHDMVYVKNGKKYLTH